MTPLMLYDDLIAEVENILRDVVTKNTAGEDVVGVKGYKYRLPLITADDEDESRFFPYFLVRLSEGKTKDDDSPWLVTADILLGVCENDKDVPGHEHIMVMIQRITDRFAAEPLLNKKFRAEQGHGMGSPGRRYLSVLLRGRRDQIQSAKDRKEDTRL